MTTAPNVSTSAWRLPSKNRAGEKRAGRFDQGAYAKLGLAEAVGGTKDARPPEGYVEPREEGRATIGADGLPSVDTSGWSLSERKSGGHRPKSELGKKWDDDPPKDRNGRPVLFSDDDEEAEKVEMKGFSMDRIKQLRRLAGLEHKEEIEFSIGTPHRRMPDDRRAIEESFKPGKTFWHAQTRTMDVWFMPLAQQKNGGVKGLELEVGKRSPKKKSIHKMDVPGHPKAGGFWKSEEPPPKIKGYFQSHDSYPAKTESRVGSLANLPPEVRRLVEPRAASLPSGGLIPHRPVGAGVLDPITSAESHGDAYINKVLAESKWFLKDFGDLALGGRLGEEPNREAWSGSNPDYSDELVDPDPDPDDEDDDKGRDDDEDDDEEDDDDDEEMGEARRRIKTRHTGPGGRGKIVRMGRQSREQAHRNKNPGVKRAKKNWERTHKSQRARSARLSRHAGVDEAFIDELSIEAVEERLGDIIKRAGRKMGHGTKQSRGAVDKVKSKVKDTYDKWHSKEAKKSSRRKKAKSRLRRIKSKAR